MHRQSTSKSYTGYVVLLLWWDSHQVHLQTAAAKFTYWAAQVALTNSILSQMLRGVLSGKACR